MLHGLVPHRPPSQKTSLEAEGFTGLLSPAAIPAPADNASGWHSRRGHEGDRSRWHSACYKSTSSLELTCSQSSQWKLSPPQWPYKPPYLNPPHLSRFPHPPRCPPPTRPSTTAAASFAPLPPSTSPNGSPTRHSQGDAPSSSASTVPETRLTTP